MRFRGVFILFALTLFLSGVPLRQAFAGGPKPGCAGWVCGKTYTPDEDYAAQSSLRAAIGERAFEMFPNFYRLSYALWGGVGAVLGNPVAQRGLEALEQASYGTPIGADEVAFRALRNLPRVAGGLDEAGGVAAALGTMARRGGDELAETLPHMRVVPPAGKQKLQEMIAKGEVYLTEPSVFTVREGFEEVVTREAFHGSQRVGGYGMSRMGNVLEVSQIWTDPAYQGGHLATEAVAGYIRGNPGIRYITASMEEVNTVKFIEDIIGQGHPNEWMKQAVAGTPLGKIGAATGAKIRPVRLQRQVDPVTQLPYYDVLVELLR